MRHTWLQRLFEQHPNLPWHGYVAKTMGVFLFGFLASRILERLYRPEHFEVSMFALFISLVAIAWFGFVKLQTPEEYIPEAVEGPVRARRIVVCPVSSGPRGLEVPRFVINHHAARLERLFLLASTQSEENALKLKTEVESKYKKVSVEIIPIADPMNFRDTIKAMKGPVTSSMRREWYDWPHGCHRDVICDCTGMPVPVSVGLALWCIPHQVSLQYTTAKYLDGKAEEVFQMIEIPLRYRLQTLTAQKSAGDRNESEAVTGA